MILRELKGKEGDDPDSTNNGETSLLTLLLPSVVGKQHQRLKDVYLKTLEFAIGLDGIKTPLPFLLLQNHELINSVDSTQILLLTD